MGNKEVKTVPLNVIISCVKSSQAAVHLLFNIRLSRQQDVSQQALMDCLNSGRLRVQTCKPAAEQTGNHPKDLRVDVRVNDLMLVTLSAEAEEMDLPIWPGPRPLNQCPHH